MKTCQKQTPSFNLKQKNLLYSIITKSHTYRVFKDTFDAPNINTTTYNINELEKLFADSIIEAVLDVSQQDLDEDNRDYLQEQIELQLQQYYTQITTDKQFLVCQQGKMKQNQKEKGKNNISLIQIDRRLEQQ